MGFTSSSCPGPAAVEGDVRGDQRAAVGRALDAELAVEDGEPVRQPDEAGAFGPGAADAVVAHSS